MDNTLAKKFTFSSLLSFAIPNIIMMISLSMYIIIDGMFVSRLIGTTALSAVNMFYPAICFEMAIAIMIATGGSAIVARKMGEGKQKEAQNNLSLLIVVELLIGIFIAIFGNLFTSNIVSFLGASSTQAPLSITYAKIIFTFAPAFFLQTAFQTFFVTAGKPTLGLIVTILAGVTNIVLDYMFMAPLNMGVAGAAIATGIGYCIPAFVGIVFFLTAKNNSLHFVRPRFDSKVLLKSCTNGSSEMVTNLANAATTFLFNYTLLQFYGENGVASITIILYFQYIFTALYFGYSNGIAPILSYKFGNDDKMQLKSIFKNSILFLIISSIVANILIHITVTRALTIFTPANSDVYNIALHGFNIYSLAFIIMGLGIFSSSMFTAFSDGKTSAIISFSRTFIFIIGAVLILPTIFGEIGVWIAVPIAEILGFIVALFYLLTKKKISYI
ncbi:MATE family efflux transporter [Extibacter muris]|uniref:MATE family efflux transporter n=1 Tax=Extibacter muris TaxID=1796622 RepID=UPI001D075EB5|nr:MATE family efflux transporter [Extibacter muris]MCB6202668.1 MATE family efflux transporter [Extibacter muris]MCQ4663905.1 MATE family efflux transporter [Extibacter muris]MCQ4693471.1 MATE family efflux transporter [Extibacter muris]